MRNLAVLALVFGVVSVAGAGPFDAEDELLSAQSVRPFSSWDQSLFFEGLDLSHFNLRNDEKGLEIDGGYLNPSGTDPLLGRSPYFSLTKRWSSTGRYFDTDTGIQLGVLDLEARYGPDYGDGAGDTGFESSTIFVGSVLSRVGRAYHLFGPLDVGWSTMGLLRVTDIFPNIALDQSVGARVQLGDNSFLGYFTGVTASAARMTKDWGKTELDDTLIAPHQGISLWGRFPNSLTDYSLSMRTQDNPLTQVETLSASFAFPTRRGPVSIFTEKDRESGPDIEFDRKRTSLGIRMKTSRNWEASASFGRDEIQFGNVGSESNSVMFSIKYKPEKRSRGSRSVASLLTDRNTALPPSETTDIAAALQANVTRLQALLDEAMALLELAGDGPAAAQTLIDAINSIDPELRALLEAEFGEFDQSVIDPDALQLLLDEAAAELTDASVALQKVADFLADPKIIDRIAARYARDAIYEKLAEVEVDLFGRTIRMSPTKLIAFAHVYGIGLDPILPITAKNMRDLIERECGGDAAQCLLNELPEADREELEELLGDDLSDALGEILEWATERVRQEANLVLLQVYLAAEQLDRLSIDRGRRIGSLNQDALMTSFSHLDARRAQVFDSIYPRLQRSARLELQSQQFDTAGRMMSHGQAGLDRLMKSPGWPKNVEVRVPPEDWAALLGHYGKKNFFRFIQNSAQKVSKRETIVKIQRLAFRFDPNGAKILRDGTTTVSLPPVQRKPKLLLAQLLEML